MFVNGLKIYSALLFTTVSDTPSIPLVNFPFNLFIICFISTSDTGFKGI
jgi:hypothetical protein